MKPAFLPRALTVVLLALTAASAPATAQTLDKVSFGTNWVAQAEHGGFFQAVADGTYNKYGLDVTIVPGGPNDNNRMLLISGKIDFFMTANTLMSFDAVANNVPVVAIAATAVTGTLLATALKDCTLLPVMKKSILPAISSMRLLSFGPPGTMVTSRPYFR